MIFMGDLPQFYPFFFGPKVLQLPGPVQVRSPQQPRHFPDWQRGAGCWDHWGPVLTKKTWDASEVVLGELVIHNLCLPMYVFFPAVSKKMFFFSKSLFFWPRAFFMFFMILDTWLIPVWPLLGPRGPYGGSTASFEAVETWKGGMTLNQAGMVVYIKLIHFFQMGIPPSTHLKSEC